MKTFNSEFQEIKIWFTDHTSMPLEIEDKINNFDNSIMRIKYKNELFIEPRERRYVKGYGFLSFARNIGTHAAEAAKSMSNKYSQKLVDTAKKSATDAIKTASKRAIQKTAETAGDLIGNKIADNITSASKKSPNERNTVK